MHIHFWAENKPSRFKVIWLQIDWNERYARFAQVGLNLYHESPASTKQ